MDKETVILPDFLIADLYKNSLVITDDVQKTKTESSQDQVKEVSAEMNTERKWYLGNNLKKITLLVNEKNAVYLEEDSLQFLSSILGACKLNLGDVAIVNYYNDPVDYLFISKNLEPTVLIFFGINTQQVHLPFTVPYYQVQKYDSKQFLFAPPLESMLGNTQDAKLEKSKLWLCLKKMFNI